MEKKLWTTKEIAEVLGITTKHVQRLEQQGVFKKAQFGKYVLPDTVKRYVEYQVELEKKRHEKKAEKENDPRHRIQLADARRKELELGRLEGTLVDKNEVIALWQSILAITRNRYLSLINLAPRLRNMRSVKNIKALLNSEIRKILDELASARNIT